MAGAVAVTAACSPPGTGSATERVAVDPTTVDVTNPNPGERKPLPRPLADDRLTLRPTGRSLPANRTVFHLTALESVTSQPHDFYVLDAAGREVMGAVTRWTWTGDGLRAEIPLVGLVPGAYVFVVEDLTFDGGDVVTGSARFEVTPADTTPPEFAATRAGYAPTAGTTEPLVVRFPEPMDHGTLANLSVLVKGKPVPGAWRFDAAQQSATFTPGGPWPEGPTFLSVAGAATDLAGNALQGAPARPVPLPPREASP